MTWSEPELSMLNMNAEIGGYQNDFDDEPRPYYGGRQSAPAAVESAPQAQMGRGLPRKPEPQMT